jgi:glycosyltransferase involved in cell wall biosynthesis
MSRNFSFWEHRGFCFDDVDGESACLPYEKASLTFRHLALHEVREVRIVGFVANIAHTEDPEHDPRDGFYKRLFFTKRPTTGSGWRQWIAARTALPQALNRLVRFLENRPGFRLAPDLNVRINGTHAGRFRGCADANAFELKCPVNPAVKNLDIELALSFCVSDILAWLGNYFAVWPLPRTLWIRLQKHHYRFFQHRRLRVQAVEFDGKTALSFSERSVRLEREIIHNLWNPGINLTGFFDHPTGIGESVRCAARAAQAADIPISCIQLKCTTEIRGQDTEFSGRLVEDNPHLVNLFHLIPTQGQDLDRAHGSDFRKGKYNIAYWAWELEEFPSGWASLHRYFDEIWAPSRFAADAIASKLPLPTLVMPHAIDFPIPEGDVRARFDLPENLFLFLFAFDLNSLSVRKNPEAAVRAFQKAFSGSSMPAGLVIKTQGAEANPEDFAHLREIARQTPHCFLISQTLSRADVMRLQKSCDCFVSLHRSEGFGLSVAEAMYLGKPAISTNWSATAEFVTPQNGCPVEVELVTLEKNHDVYPKGSVWAEPNVDHAAAHMRKLAQDPAWAARLGAQAASDIRRRFSPKAVGELYRRRLEALHYW